MRKFGFLLLSCCLLASLTFAQTFRGGIQGTVTDSSGAAITGAEVKIVNAGTGFSRTVSTNDVGTYSATELPLGNYTVSVSKENFRTSVIGNVAVSVGSLQRADAQLKPGQVQETVEVTADVPLVEGTTDTMGGTIEGEQATELPINGRDFTKLLVMVPGATGDPVGSVDSPGSFGLFSVNGNRGRSNNYLLDGTDMNDGYRNLPAINEAGVYGTPATILPVDALAEIPVMSNVEPEYGRNSGAIVNLVTRSGTNQLHGSGFEYFRNSWLDSRNYFNTTDQPKNQFHNNQFGGSLGGPIVRDKSFFFVAYEGQREVGGLPTAGTVPTQQQITAALGGNTINPVIGSLLARNPWGVSLPATGDGTVQFTVPFTNSTDSLIGKIDQHMHLLSANDLLTGRYFFGTSEQSFPLGLVGGGGGAPGYNTVTPTHANILSLSYTTPLTSNFLMEFRGGYLRYQQDFYAQDKSFDPRTIGLDTLSSSATANDFGLPYMAIAGYSSLGANLSVPRGRIDTNYQLFTNTSWTKGTHNIKWGYEFRRTFINGFFDNGYRGQLKFASLTDFLQGDPTGYSRSAEGDSKRYTYQNNDGLYVQDSWRATQRLTLNYGVRWDYFGVIGEKHNQLSILNAAGELQYVGTPGLDKLYPRDLNNFAPRLSFAYDLTGKGKTVIRGGWGVFYDAASQDFFVGQLPWNTFNPGPAYNNIQFTSTTNTIAAGAPVFPASSYNASDVFTVDQNLRTPYVQNFNLNVQHQFSSKLALQVGYVGSDGHKLFRFVDLNQVNPATGTVAYPSLGYVNQFQSSANSHYDSLQASLKMQSWHGLSSTLNYTWGHSIDNASDGQDYVPNAAQPDNSFNPGGERASSNFDTRHRIQWYWTYNVPNLNQAKWLTAGWALDGVAVYSTGQPFGVNYMFEDDYNGSGEYFGRPDLVGSPFAGTSGPSQFLNLAAFAAPCTWDSVAGGCVAGSQHFGDVGRNAFRGPNYGNFDFSLSKTSKLTEKLTMQIRADFFNIFNHPNFSNPLLPNFNIDIFQNVKNDDPSQSGGRGVGYLPITATPDVGTGNPYLGGGGPRDIQLALRLSF